MSEADYKLMISRLEPQKLKEVRICGYLETYHLPTTIPDIIQDVAQKYGGGKFQIKIVDKDGKYIKQKTFEVSGLPKIPAISCNCPIDQLLMKGCQVPNHE